MPLRKTKTRVSIRVLSLAEAASLSHEIEIAAPSNPSSSAAKHLLVAATTVAMTDNKRGPSQPQRGKCLSPALLAQH